MDEFATITSDELKKKLESDDDFVANVEAAVADKSVTVIVYCASFSCDLSPEAAQNLVDAGFENVIDYEGGLKDWVENGFDLEGDDVETMAEELTEE